MQLTAERIKEVVKEVQNLKIRCSSISRIMAYPNDSKVPKGAMTAVEEIVDQILFNFYPEVNTKEMRKGNLVEDDSIVLYNSIFFTNFKKADKPIENDWLKTQSCDIDDEESDAIIDIKSSWSKKQFPKTVKKALASLIKAGYDWQLQGYMTLYGRKKAVVAYCLTDTPEGLCEWEPADCHFMDDVDDNLRVTKVEFNHDPVKEAQIIARVQSCRIYALEYLNEILTDHGFSIAA